MKITNRNTGVICSMSYHEMKLMIHFIKEYTEDKEVLGEDVKKNLTNLSYKLSNMISKQCIREINNDIHKL